MNLGKHIVLCGQINHRNPHRLKILHQLKAVFSRQHHIHKGKSHIFVRRFPALSFAAAYHSFEKALRTKPVHNRQRMIPGRFQIHTNQLRNGTVIFYYQNFRFHDPSPPHTISIISYHKIRAKKASNCKHSVLLSKSCCVIIKAATYEIICEVLT